MHSFVVIALTNGRPIKTGRMVFENPNAPTDLVASAGR
jgi:hypothetical protein